METFLLTPQNALQSLAMDQQRTGNASRCATTHVSQKEVKQMALDWKPRHRDMIIGDIPWLARISDKAQAKLQGILGEYIYP